MDATIAIETILRFTDESRAAENRERRSRNQGISGHQGSEAVQAVEVLQGNQGNQGAAEGEDAGERCELPAFLSTLSWFID